MVLSPMSLNFRPLKELLHTEKRTHVNQVGSQQKDSRGEIVYWESTSFRVEVSSSIHRILICSYIERRTLPSGAWGRVVMVTSKCLWPGPATTEDCIRSNPHELEHVCRTREKRAAVASWNAESAQAKTNKGNSCWVWQKFMPSGVKVT